MSPVHKRPEAPQGPNFTFRLQGVRAASVALVGSFNEWSTTRHLMDFTEGDWETRVALPPGKHSYCYFVIEHDQALRGSLQRIGSTIDVQHVSPVAK